MFWHAVGVSILATAMLAGCAAAPTVGQAETDVDQITDAADSVVAGTGVIEEVLSDADTATNVGCREQAVTGSNIKRMRCKPPKDDSKLIPLISAPRH